MRIRFLALLLLFSIIATGLAFAQSAEENNTAGASSTNSAKEDLQNLIKTRSEELEKINRALEATQQNLQTTKSQSRSLQQQMSQLSKNINQLELSIQSDQVTNQKLALEIDALGYDIRDIELTMSSKRGTIGHVLRELQKRDGENPLLTFLKNGNLAETFFETQSLIILKNQLQVDIDNLSTLQNQLNGKVGEVQTKKTEIDQRTTNLQYRKSLIEDQKEERKIILAQTKSKESIYEQQVAELKKQQDSIEDEIAKIENQLRAQFDSGVLPPAREGLLGWPVELVSAGGKGRVSQHFGEKSNLYRGKPHNGLDIAAPIGTPVYAAEDGVVLAVDNNDRSTWSKYQYGKYVMIKHANGLATLYAHLSKWAVDKGAEVKRGDLIGYSGSTGYSTGPHLHFGAYWASSVELRPVPPAAGLVPVGVLVDPEQYLQR